jgi:dihydrofolate synthase/folylpolyglutamate synthase
MKNSYQEALRYLYGLQKYGIKFGLNMTSNLLEKLGNPHHGQAYIHIGGTNGKGSVAAMLEGILRHAGYRVGLYTSPHLLRFTERFRVNGKEIPEDVVSELVSEMVDIMDPGDPPTFFEVTTAMALLYFTRQNTDISIIEVGMGGRLDATNVINPLVTVITNISLEHQFFLGKTLRDIAYEKAGIIKEGVDLVTGVSQPHIAWFFRDVCKKKKAPFWRLGEKFSIRTKGSKLNYHGIGSKLKGIELSLKGKFQASNAGLALCVVELLQERGFKVKDDHIFQALSQIVWPGRVQVFSKAPYIILDGAHNPTAMRKLRSVISNEFVFKDMILVVGIMEDKDIRDILREIVPIANHVIYTRPKYYRSADPTQLEEGSRKWCASSDVIRNIPDAINRAREMARPKDLILITGSLFTVGEALSYLDPVQFRPDSA